MKKLFTLFAAALVGFCAFAQDAPETCPSKLALVPVQAEQDADNVQLELTLVYNNSDNLNGFNLEVSKTGGEWVNFDPIVPTYFTATDYAANILANLNLSQAQAAQYLTTLCDVMSNVKESGNLVMIEILKTNTCRFFPRVNEGEDEPLAVGKCAIDLSGCEDGDYTISAPANSPLYSLSYTGGPEGNRGWSPEEPLEIVLTKTGDKVTVKGATPEPVTITGTVVDENQNPLEGVTVTLSAGEGTEAITATTNAEGAYTMEVVPAEDAAYTMTFAKDGYVTKTIAVESLEAVPEVVVLEAVKVTITGKVTDELDAPLAGVTVTLDEAAGAKEAVTATTAADGTFSLTYTPVEGKEYNVSFAKDGYVPASYGVDELPETVVLVAINTGINTIGSDNVNGRIYDLQGRELKSVPEHGIYIQNGKKHVK